MADGTLQTFDGDLDDYRDALLNPKVEKRLPQEAKKERSKQERKKVNPQRLQRLEREMEKLNERKAAIEAKLADPAIYADPQALKAALLDQAYVAKELGEAEAEWLEWADSAP